MYGQLTFPTYDEYINSINITSNSIQFLNRSATVLSQFGLARDSSETTSTVVLATSTLVDKKIKELIGNAPEALDTLKELADALNNDASFASTLSSQLSNKVDKVTGKGLSTNDFTTELKNKLEGIATGANNYTLPDATSTVKGGVKIGSNITVSSGTISLTKANVTTALGYTPPTTDINVKQTNTTNNTSYPILLKNGNGTTEVTSSVLFNSNITINPSTSTITATNFAGTATKANQDGSGNVITTTYVTKANAVSSISVTNGTMTITKADGSTSTASVGTTYTLPDATSTVKGGVKIGSNITVSSGTISLTKANVTTALGYTPPTENDIVSNYLKLSGGSLTGTLTFANKTWNTVGDDAQFGDFDVAGTLGIRGANGTTALALVKRGSTTDYATIQYDGTNLIFNKTLTANITGSAESATNDGSGRNISTTYVEKATAVLGVKGDAETSYRTSNVNITKANIGLGNVENTADANKNVSSAKLVSTTIPAASTANLIYATIGTNDYFRILAGGASNAGYAEISTADDGNEPIYVRQYSGNFVTLVRTLTLLDESGNSSFPGTVTATNFAGTATKANQDGSGNVITTTYANKSSVITSLSYKDDKLTYTFGNGTSSTITIQSATVADYKVEQILTDDNSLCPILFTDYGRENKNDNVKYSYNILVNPYTGTIVANKFDGLATKATSDADGYSFSEYYYKKINIWDGDYVSNMSNYDVATYSDHTDGIGVANASSNGSIFFARSPSGRWIAIGLDSNGILYLQRGLNGEATVKRTINRNYITGLSFNQNVLTLTRDDGSTTTTSVDYATTTAYGTVKIGSNITVSSGTISLTKANVTTALGYTPPTENTNNAVTQTNNSANTAYPIIFRSTTGTATTTTAVYFNSNITINPSTSTITATNFAGTATKANQDGSGNVITTTYATKAETIKSISISGTTLTYTMANNTTGTATLSGATITKGSATIPTNTWTASTDYGYNFRGTVTINNKGITTDSVVLVTFGIAYIGYALNFRIAPVVTIPAANQIMFHSLIKPNVALQFDYVVL